MVLGMVEATIEDSAFPHLLGGGTASLSPFQRSPSPSHGSLPPLLGLYKASCDQGGHTPLDPPNIVSPQRCCSSKEPDEVRRRGCIEHTFGKEVGPSLNRGHPSSAPRANARSSAATEKGSEEMALRI